MTTGVPNAATITVPETLDILDGPFADLATGVAENRYVLWLGSGISFGRVDGLRQVVSRVMEFLRGKINLSEPGCKFKKALKEALNLASLTEAEKAEIDLALPFERWTAHNEIVNRLCTNYARLLDISVEGEEDDYLLWNAVEVCRTFADPDKTPDVEHLCLAILILEGACSEIASANWDNLIENSVADLTGGQNILSIFVSPEDLREPQTPSRLIKFHGCAAKALENEATYRHHLVARQSQINSWPTLPEIAAIRTRLIDLVTTKPTLMIGLSAQDFNIQALFAQAAVNMPWRWTEDKLSLVFSENELGGDQQGLLKNVYRHDISASNRLEIANKSRIKAYAKPLLLSLVLHLLCTKVRALADIAPGTVSLNDRQLLRDGVVELRNQLATHIATDPLAFINTFIDQWGRAMKLIRNGSLLPEQGRYQPLTLESVQNISTNPNLTASGMREIAVAIGLLGHGLSIGVWEINLPSSGDVSKGILSVKTASGLTNLFLCSGPFSAIQLCQDAQILDEDQPIFIHGLQIIPEFQRAPRSAPSRTGNPSAREVSITSLMTSSQTFEELFTGFREALSI